MPRFMLVHRHAPEECRIAFAAWRGFDSPLRHNPAIGSCANGSNGADGGHELWWTVDAADRAEALSCLPDYLAERTQVVEVEELAIP
jgi:hypothetical protein